MGDCRHTRPTKAVVLARQGMWAAHRSAKVAVRDESSEVPNTWEVPTTPRSSPPVARVSRSLCGHESKLLIATLLINLVEYSRPCSPLLSHRSHVQMS